MVVLLEDYLILMSKASANTANYSAAASAIGGDKLTSRVFWDTP